MSRLAVADVLVLLGHVREYQSLRAMGSTRSVDGLRIAFDEKDAIALVETALYGAEMEAEIRSKRSARKART